MGERAQRLADYVLALFGGSLIGAMVCVSTVCSLLEISVNDLFSILFGLMLELLGVGIFWRILTASIEGTSSMYQSQLSEGSSWKKSLLGYLELTFASSVFVSGLFCILLDKNWCKDFNVYTKIPMYTLLGTSLSFAITFTFTDLVNFAHGHATDNKRPLVGTVPQLYLLLVASLIVGCVTGFMFGSFDAEGDEAPSPELWRSYAREHFEETQYWSIWVGAVAGALCGALNERIRGPAGEEDIARFSAHDDL